MKLNDAEAKTKMATTFDINRTICELIQEFCLENILKYLVMLCARQVLTPIDYILFYLEIELLIFFIPPASMKARAFSR